MIKEFPVEGYIKQLAYCNDCLTRITLVEEKKNKGLCGLCLGQKRLYDYQVGRFK